MVICLPISTTFEMGVRSTSLLLNVHNVSDVREVHVHTAELLVLSLSLLDVEIFISKVKKFKVPNGDQI
jgi:hypothetical protein